MIHVDRLAGCIVYRSMNMNREISKIVVGINCADTIHAKFTSGPFNKFLELTRDKVQVSNDPVIV